MADCLPLPTGVRDLDAPIELTTTAGTCLFFPIGYWHEVEASEDCFAVNLVLKPPRWVDAIAAAIRRKLLAQPALRAPFFGALTDGNDSLRQHTQGSLVEGLQAYASALRSVSAEDVAWAADAAVLRWHRTCENRRLDAGPDGVYLVCPDLSRTPVTFDSDLEPVMSRLVRFRGTFSVHDLKVLAPDISIKKVFSMVAYMKFLGCLEEVTIS